MTEPEILKIKTPENGLVELRGGSFLNVGIADIQINNGKKNKRQCYEK